LNVYKQSFSSLWGEVLPSPLIPEDPSSPASLLFFPPLARQQNAGNPTKIHGGENRQRNSQDYQHPDRGLLHIAPLPQNRSRLGWSAFVLFPANIKVAPIHLRRGQKRERFQRQSLATPAVDDRQNTVASDAPRFGQPGGDWHQFVQKLLCRFVHQREATTVAVITVAGQENDCHSQLQQ